MSISRRLPRTVDETVRALQLALRMAKVLTENGEINLAFSQETLEMLKEFIPLFNKEIHDKTVALQSQTEITKKKSMVKNDLKRNISHFIQALNRGISRGNFKQTDRTFYGIDTYNRATPNLNKEADIEKWAKHIIRGEQERIAMGGKPIYQPSATEITKLHNEFIELDKTQSTMKDRYDGEQEDVMRLINDAQFLVKNIWDEVEFTFRYDDMPSKRRKCREYGVEYISEYNEELTEA